MNIGDLKSMSIDDLWLLHERVASILSGKILEERQQLDRRLRKLQHLSTSRSRTRRPYPPVYPKYQNPNQASETWAGRGKQPRWLRNALRSGKRLDDFRIRPS